MKKTDICRQTFLKEFESIAHGHLHNHLLLTSMRKKKQENKNLVQTYLVTSISVTGTFWKDQRTESIFSSN